MDIGDTIAPTSDQLDAVDLIAGPRTFTIADVSKGNAEQPVEIALVEFPRPWRPGKSMRRVLVSCWGSDASAYVGRRVRLYCDPNVRFGSDLVGGTRIEALSHIDKKRSVPLLVSRGRSAMFTVQPLTEERPSAKQVSDAVAHFRDTWQVTAEQLEQRVGRASDAWTAADVAALRALSGELKRGEKQVADEFPTPQSESENVRSDAAADDHDEDAAALNAEAKQAEAERDAENTSGGLFS